MRHAIEVHGTPKQLEEHLAGTGIEVLMLKPGEPTR